MTLLQAFAQVPDFRKRGGRRHPLPCVLVCILLGSLSGYSSWRDLGDFVRRHHAALVECLQLEKDRLPSYSTLRRVLKGLDFKALNAAFLAWARQHIPVEPGEALAMDGKSLCGTTTDATGAQQNFTALVSLYAHKRGIVLQNQAYQNKEESEVHVVQAMLADAKLEGATLTLDAMHCLKKPLA